MLAILEGDCRPSWAALAAYHMTELDSWITLSIDEVVDIVHWLTEL